MKGSDWKQIYAVLGPGSGKLIYTGDEVADPETRSMFAEAYERAAKSIRRRCKATLFLGTNDYPFPFPLVKGGEGWNSTRARAPRKSRSPRRRKPSSTRSRPALICRCPAGIRHQRPRRNGCSNIATKLVSTPGKQDGLYWPTKDAEAPSPSDPS